MMASKGVIFLILLIWPALIVAQNNRYIVSFKDKSNTPFTVNEPQKFLSLKSIERRSNQQILISEDDLPVNPAYVAGVKGLGAKTFFTSRWMNCLLIEASVSLATSIQNLPYVSKVELVASGVKLMGGRTKRWKNKNETSEESATVSQLEQIGLDEMQQEGYRGEGQTIAVFDSGFPGVNVAAPFDGLFKSGRIKATYNFVANNTNVYQYDDHGTEVLSVMAAETQGFTGGAYKADFMLFVTEDFTSEYRIEEFNWLFAAEKADSAGVNIINASVGYNLFDDASMNYKPGDMDGKTAIVTKAAVMAISKGMVVLCSAGNEGSNSWQLVTPPADAEGILAVGSITQQFSKSSFSSVGPSTDGRVKPDVVALGSGTAVVKPSGAISSNSGTSFASPLVASLVAGIWQAYPQLTAKEVYDAVIRSSNQFMNPDTQKGYGVPHFNTIRNYLEPSDLVEWITLHPNPITGDAITITLKDPQGDPLDVIIYDVQGRILTESQLIITWQNNPYNYAFSGLASGTYFVKVKSPSDAKIIRIVKL
jgi:serine protease AprX